MGHVVRARARKRTLVRVVGRAAFKPFRRNQALTCDVSQKRSRGIEPPFSAWEAQRWVLRNLVKVAKAQLKSCSHLPGVNRYCTLLCVACGTKSRKINPGRALARSLSPQEASSGRSADPSL